MATNIQQFEQVILQLMSPDNQQRTQAEAIFNETKKTPDFCTLSLLTLIGNSQLDQVKSLSAVLLRRNAKKVKDALWVLISPQTQEQFKAGLLDLLEKEQNAGLRKKIADCIGELASTILGDENPGTWNEILPFLFKCTKSPVDGHRECALNIFNKLSLDIGEQMRPHFQILINILSDGLKDANIKVRIAALNATSGFLNILNDESEKLQFQNMTPLMLATVSTALNAGDEEDARSALQLFVNLAELDPNFLRPHLPQIIGAMMTIATATTLEDSTRQLGVEFLVTLAESRPAMVRKIPKFVENLVPIILNMMLQIEDDNEWNAGNEGDEIEITDSDVGEECLDRLALAQGGNVLIPVIFGILPNFFSSPDWKHRHTALMAISIVGEGCRKQFDTLLPQIVKSVVQFSQDSHPRVRWAACNALGQMSSDFGPEFQQQFHGDVVPTLVNVMGDTANPRVQSHSAAAIINFCEHATPDVLTPHLDSLLAKLLSLMREGKTMVQEQVVTAIAAIADCMESSFIKYYDTVMPFLKSILSNANSHEYRMLRGKTMECISLIGVAVGKEKFYQDAKEIMEQFMKTQSGTLEADDPQIGFLLQSWARICRCMGQDFVPYLGYVMPPLLQSANITPDITISEVTEGEEEKEVEGYEFIPIGEKRIGINTSALEEKATACNMLYCYASELKEGFFPYVDEVTKLLVPLMKFYYNDGVRQAAVTSMPHLLASSLLYLQKNAVKGADSTYVRSLWQFMFPPFLDSLKDEMDGDILVDGLEAFTSCLKLLGEGFIDEEALRKINQVIAHIFKEIEDKAAERTARRNEEDNDDEEEEKIEEEEIQDENIVAGLAELIGVVAKISNKQMFAVLFQEFVPTLLNMMKPTATPSSKQNAICIIDDIVEFLGPHSLPFFQAFLPPVVQFSTDTDPAIRQAAAFGVGLFAATGGEQIGPYIAEMLNRLTQIIGQPESRDKLWAGPTDNAIGSVAKILKHHPSRVSPHHYPLFLSWLPVTYDKVESIVTYGILCDLLDESNPHILGENFQNVPRILAILADVYQTELINDQVGQRIVNIVKQLRSTKPELLQNVWTSLSDVQRQKLQSMI